MAYKQQKKKIIYFYAQIRDSGRGKRNRRWKLTSDWNANKP